MNQRVAIGLLQRAGHSPTIVADGQAALEAVQADQFDLVLMDYHVPVMDGISATRAIRGLDGVVSRVPIIAATAARWSMRSPGCGKPEWTVW